MRLFLDEAKKLLKMNTVTVNGNEEAANYLQSILQSRGIKTQLQLVTHSNEEYSKRQFNVVGILGDPLVDRKTRKGLLLLSHLDTTTPGLPENWVESERQPLMPAVKEGKIYGLGAADAKLDFLCKLHAVEKFREKKIKQPIYLVGTCGQGAGMLGSQYLIKSLALNPRAVLIGEPTGLQLVSKHKAQTILKIVIGYQMVERDARGFNRRLNLYAFGKSAHGANPDQGANAIQRMNLLLRTAVDNGFEIRFTALEGGDTYGKVPDSAGCEIYLTSHQFEDFKPFFRAFVREEGLEKCFRAELGGLGDVGVRFLPDPLFDCICEIEKFFDGQGRGESTRAEDGFTPAGRTVNFSRIKRAQGQIELYFDIRLMPDQDVGGYEMEIQKGLAQIAKRFPSLIVSAQRFRFCPSFQGTENSELQGLCKQALQDVGVDPVVSSKSTSTEAAIFQQAGFESCVFGPGDPLLASHTPDERVIYKDLEKATAFYTRVIERFCL